jgi:hypothetical protein
MDVEERTKIDDKLDDLQTGDPLLPPDPDTTGTLEVVPVHDDVDEEVDGDGHPLDRGQADQLGVAEEGSGAMVVCVKEGQGLLLKEEEDGIEELQVLGQVVQL